MSFDITKPAPIVILIKPQLGENIGMCARAMLNCGLTDMRIVDPRDGWPNARAGAAASGADIVIENTTIFENTKDAIADCNIVMATTNRTRDMIKPVYTARNAVPFMQNAIMAEQKRVAIMFGPERTGLENSDLSLCTDVITIPLNPDFSSLNLAQAVLVCAYEWVSLTQFDAVDTPIQSTGKSDWADQKELDFYLNRLDQALENKNFYKSKEIKESVHQNIQNMFKRHDWTSQEIQTLHGMITAFDKD